MTAIALRPATAADTDFSFRLHRATMRPYVAQIWGWDDDVQEAMHNRRFNPATTQVITVDGVDAGILVTEQRPTELYLERIAIDPSHQGEGIGSRVIQGLLTEATERGKTMVLEVLTTNPRAEALYRRLGFHEESRHGPDNIKIQLRA